MGKYRTAALKAQKLTNKQLATEMATLAPLSRETLQDLLPYKRDKQAFLALMEQVERETETEDDLNFLTDNMRTAGAVVFKILRAFL